MPDATPETPNIRFCRHLTVKGVQCRQRALIGQTYCVKHANHRSPVCPGPGESRKVAIPLLEDVATIQVQVTQIIQGIVSGALDPQRGGKALYGCSIAASLLPRPARLKPSEKEAEPERPVAAVEHGPTGELLGPDEPWIDPNPEPDTRTVEEIWEAWSKPLYDGCRHGMSGWCGGTRKINCCGGCRKDRLAQIAEAESQRDHWDFEEPAEIIIKDLIVKYRAEADESAAKAAAEAEATAAEAAGVPHICQPLADVGTLESEPAEAPPACQPSADVGALVPNPATLPSLTASADCSLLPVPCSLLPVPCSLLPVPCSLPSFPVVEVDNIANPSPCNTNVVAVPGGYPISTISTPLTPDCRPLRQRPPARRLAASPAGIRG